MSNPPESTWRKGRVWTFDHFRYNELLCELTRDGLPVDITEKPRGVLFCLLEKEGGVVSADELNKRVWPDVSVSEHVLRTTVLAIRKALGDDERKIIKAVHSVGYRMGVRVTCQVEEDFISPALELKAGDRVPGRPDWILESALDHREPHAVWLTHHITNRQARVYKIADDGVRLHELEREMTLSRLLPQLAPRATCFVQVQDWQLDTIPYLLGTEFGGTNLQVWATEQRAVGGLSRATCLEVITELCDAVDLLHEFNINHNDLKPANLLVDGGEGQWRVKLTDFGDATLMDTGRFAEFNISGRGFTSDPTAVTGSAMYLAPEVQPGQAPTRSSDIYAVGVILFQLLSGDFRKTPVPGWEHTIDDPLLREDIALAVELDPMLRLKSAAELANRLRTVDERRAIAQAEIKRAGEDEELRRRDQRSRARRPYLVGLFAALLLGLLSTGWFYHRAVRERRITEEINRFLADDLLAQLDPDRGQGASETLLEAIQEVRPLIDTRFASQPEVAAQLHQTLALALDNGQKYQAADEEYDHAAADWIAVEGPLSENALYLQYQHTLLEARDFRPGSLGRAQALQEKEDALLRQIHRPWAKVRVVQLEAEGTIALVSGKPAEAVSHYQQAVDLAAHVPDISVNLRLTTKQRLCHGELRAAQASQAGQCFQEVKNELRARGEAEDHLAPEEVGLAQALRYQGKFPEEIAQIDAVYSTVLKQLGPDADYPMVLLGMRAEAEAALEQWHQAIQDDQMVVEHTRKVNPNSFPAIAGLSDLGQMECRSGSAEAGERDEQAAVRAIDLPGGNPGFIGAIKEALASCLIPPIPGRAGNPARLNEAERLLNGINVPVVSGSLGDAQWGANVALDRARIAFYRGQRDLAVRYLRTATSGLTSPLADRYQKKTAAALEAALASVPQSREAAREGRNEPALLPLGTHPANVSAVSDPAGLALGELRLHQM